MRVRETNAPFSLGGIVGKMKNDKSPSEGKIPVSDVNHDAKARREQLEKARKEWEKKAKFVDDSLKSGDK